MDSRETMEDHCAPVLGRGRETNACLVMRSLSRA
jgi:hypothetical protein